MSYECINAGVQDPLRKVLYYFIGKTPQIACNVRNFRSKTYFKKNVFHYDIKPSIITKASFFCFVLFGFINLGV